MEALGGLLERSGKDCARLEVEVCVRRRRCGLRTWCLRREEGRDWSGRTRKRMDVVPLERGMGLEA